MSGLAELWCAISLLACLYMFSVVASLRHRDAPHLPRARVMKSIIASVFTVIPLIWALTGVLASIVMIPLILVLIHVGRERYRQELYHRYVVGPNIRKHLLDRYGSAGTADLEEYLAEMKKQIFFAPEVELNVKFRSKQKHKNTVQLD